MKNIKWSIIGGNKTWERKCPKCKKSLFYYDYRVFWGSQKKNVKCRSCSKIGNQARTGQKNSETHRKNLSLALRGRKISDYCKLKMRLAAVKRIKEKRIKPYTNYNPNACIYFDSLNEKKGWNLHHALNGGETECIGYFLDAYDKDKNIVVEYDEPRHDRPSSKKKDLIRQRNIIKHLGCRFYRYKQSQNRLVKV